MQFPGQGKPPVGILFDTDLGSIDEALALALLYGFDGKREARLVSVSITQHNLKAAAFCEAVGRFYMGAVSGAFGGFGRTLPVGLSTAGNMTADAPMLAEPLARRHADGKPVHESGIHQLNDTAEVTALIRNALTAQHDQNALVVLAGPATNLARLLDLPAGKDWIARKVRLLSVAAGAFPDGKPESHIQVDIPAARKLFAEWPTPIVVVGREVGETLLYPAASIEKDFAWSPAHPLVDAYRAYKPMPYDAPSGALAAVLHAVRPQETYFQLSEAGLIRVLDDGSSRFTPSAGGKHRYLIAPPAQQERTVRAFTEIASAKPVPRQSRFRPPDQQQQQKQTPPPDSAKPDPPKPKPQ